MTQLLPGSTATPDVGSAPSAHQSTESTTTRVLVTEPEVVLSTTAAISALPATGKSLGVVGFRNPGVSVPDLLSGVSLPVLGWAIA